MHIDELPQLINVINGDMSMVGPRPVTLDLFFERERSCPDYGDQFVERPGITGLSQIRGRMKVLRLGPKSAVRMAKYYRRHCCICLDCKVLAWTAQNVLFGTGI